MKKLIQLPALVGGAELRAASFDEAENTIDVIFTTGATVRRYSWSDGPYDEVLSTSPNSVRLDRLNSGAPFLNTHDGFTLSSVLGCVVRGTAKMSKGIGTAKVLLSRAECDKPIVDKIRDGIISNISVGYRTHRIIKNEADDGATPRWDVVDWEPFELSAVPMPADAGAQIRAAGAPPPDKMFDCEFITNDHDIAVARMRMAERAAMADRLLTRRSGSA